MIAYFLKIIPAKEFRLKKVLVKDQVIFVFSVKQSRTTELNRIHLILFKTARVIQQIEF